MCASVHADFCRPKGLESAQPDLAPTQYGTIEVAINYWCMGKIQYYSQCGKTIHITSSYYTLTLTVLKHSSHWRL